MSSPLIEHYRSSPSWLKALVILSVVYLSHRIWAQFMRTRRELQAASWILYERRKAGIPDSDKRPFKIAKAAVEANRKKTSDSYAPSLASASASPQSPLINQQPSSSLRSQPHLPPPSPEPSNSVETIRSFRDNQDGISVASLVSKQSQVSSNTSDRANKPRLLLNTTPSPKNTSSKSIHLKPSLSPKLVHITSHSPSTTTNQHLIGRSLQKRVAPLSTDGSDPDLPEIQQENLTTRNRKKAKTQKNPPSSQSDSELPIPGNIADNQSAQKLNSDGSPKKGQLRKKRILSDCVGETDSDQATRIKKGRSEKETEQTNPLPAAQDTISDAQVSMQVEQDGQGEEDEIEQEEEENDDEPNEDKKESDTERYMTGNDGQKKKLVQIRLNSPESNYSPEEGAAEYRWVTRRQFRDLGQRGMLLMEDDQWEGDSVTSADSLDSSLNHLSTPSKRTSSIAIEKGPIWSIEGKKSISKSPLPASEMSPKPPSVSRPRNSLGRMRLSLPPDPASPLPRSRSRLLSPLRPSIG